MAEYYAKNLGIRTARGKFVLVTNPDAVFSPQLVSFFAGRTLREDSFYTASMRFDREWPTTPLDPAKYLEALMKRVLDDKRLNGTDYAKTLLRRPELDDLARSAFDHICLQGDDGIGQMPGYWDFQAGDMALAAKSRWLQIEGYPETPWTFGVDSSALCKLFGRGLRNVALMPPCLAVHQHHRIRENPNARRVMDEKIMCNMCKQNPLQRLHPEQRDPLLWGRHQAGMVRIGPVVTASEILGLESQQRRPR